MLYIERITKVSLYLIRVECKIKNFFFLILAITPLYLIRVECKIIKSVNHLIQKTLYLIRVECKVLKYATEGEKVVQLYI